MELHVNSKGHGKMLLENRFRENDGVSKRTVDRSFPWVPRPGVLSSILFGRNVPRPAKSRIGGVKGQNMNETSSSGSAAVPAPS